MKPFSSFEKEIIVGLLLGDMWLERKGNTARMGLDHGKSQKEYANHVYILLKDWWLTEPQHYPKKKPTKIRLISHWSPLLIEYWEMFYRYLDPDERVGEYADRITTKLIPSNIEDLLTDTTLLYWYMDDGSLKSKDRNGLTLNTQGFSKAMNDTLAAALTNKLGIECKVHQETKFSNKKTYYKIYITSKGHQRVYDLLKDKILDCMQYKLKKPYYKYKVVKNFTID
jgi:hypothetical protein